MVSPRSSSRSKDTSLISDEASVAAMKFEEAQAELDIIVQNLEHGNLTLEASIAAYQRGSLLLKHCRHQLAVAEQKIQVLEKDSLVDFDTKIKE